MDEYSSRITPDWNERVVVKAGLPGGRTELALLHYAIDGLMLTRLTTHIDDNMSIAAAVDEFVDRILR